MGILATTDPGEREGQQKKLARAGLLTKLLGRMARSVAGVESTQFRAVFTLGRQGPSGFPHAANVVERAGKRCFEAQRLLLVSRAKPPSTPRAEFWPPLNA